MLVAVFAAVTGCSLAATELPISGPAGSLGAACSCPNGQPDCDGDQAQCQQGLSCVKGDDGKQICTRACPCPLNYVCKAAGLPGSRLACFKQP
jgi:hypothetical protein